MEQRKKISIATGCLNEAGNLREFYERVLAVLKQFPQYAYEFIVADNYSTDGSREILREIAAGDRHFKVILNSNNFGPIRSGYNSLLQATGDAVVTLCSDLQEPPELIAEFIRKWEEGYQVVVGVKPQTKETSILRHFRRFYYWLLAKCSDGGAIIQDFTGFGLYDRKFMDALKKFRDPLPYFRGFVSEIGFRRTEIEFVHQPRKYGTSKHNLFSLYDYAMTGFVNHTKLPLRLATFSGFCLAGVNLFIALSYLVYKLLFWETFTLGMAPLVIGLFFFAAVQLIFTGIIGEYIGAILTQVKNHPLVIEDEKLNFEDASNDAH